MVLSTHVGLLGALVAGVFAAPLEAPSMEPRQASNAQTRPRRLLGSSFGGPSFNVANPVHNATFDYVVVGGGNAGLPLAVRLAEGGHTVAVIEGGSFSEIGNSNYSQVPLYAPAFSSSDPNGVSPMVDWNFTTTPQYGEKGHTPLYPRGKTLGGSSTRNYMSYHMGTNGSYKQWAELVGDDSYEFDHFSSWFHKSLNFTPPSPYRFANATPSYAKDLLQDTQGPLRVTFGAYGWAFSTWVKNAFNSVGLTSRTDGFTTGSLFGNSYQLLTVDASTMTRDSSETSFLDRIGLANPNLIVYPSTLGKRILFDGKKRATGVEVDFGGLPLTLYARNEVIVSAGAFQSPQLLMVSGVGPSDTLQKFNIPVVANLPGVGQNMWDHVLGGISYRVNVVTTSHILPQGDYATNALQQYLSDEPHGPYASLGSDLLAFEKLPQKYRARLSKRTQQDLANFPSDWPELEFFTISGYSGPSETFLGGPGGLDFGTIDVGLVAPFSRGNVTIRSADMADKPLVNPNWLADPRDQEVVVQGWHRLREIWGAANLQPVLIGQEYYPGIANTTTDAQILDHIQSTFGSVYHASCTCKMGVKSDPMAVLDSHARVYGVQGLRVVDASSFPLLPPGHPQATVCEYRSRKRLHCHAQALQTDSISSRCSRRENRR